MALVSAVSLDISGFITGLRQMQSAVQSENITGPMEARMSTMKKVLLAGAVAFGVAVQRTYAAITAGGELAVLSRQTGIAVGELMRMRAAMQTVGLSANDAQGTVAKLEQAVRAAGSGAAGAQGDLAALGLTAEDFTGTTMEAGVRRVATALRNLRDPVEANRISMALLGQSAEAMIDAFGAGGHIESVAKALGSQAAVMQQSAGVFREIQKAFTQGLGFFDALKLKVQGFFVGLASEVGPQVLAIMRSFQGGGMGFDLTGIGQKFGATIVLMVQALRSGRFGELLGVMLKEGFANALAFFQEGLTQVTEFAQSLMDNLLGGGEPASTFATRIRTEVEYAIQQLAKLPALIPPFAEALKSAAIGFVGVIQKGIGELLTRLADSVGSFGLIGRKLAEPIREAGARLSATGAENAQRGAPVLGDIKALAKNAADLLKEGLSGVVDLVPGVARMFAGGGSGGNVVRDMQQAAAAERARIESGIMGLGAKTFEAPTAAETIARVSRAQQVFGMFGSVGGGTVRGSFQSMDPMVSQQKQTNALLKQVITNTSKAPAMAAPAYQQ